MSGRRQLAFAVALSAGALCILLLVFAYSNPKLDAVPGAVWLARDIAAAFVGASFLLVNFGVGAKRSIDDYINEAAADEGIFLQHYRQTFQGLWRPLVSLLPTSEKLADAAAGAIKSVIKETADGKRRIVFFGAVSLQTPPSGLTLVPHGDGDDEQTPHQVYQGALEAASSARALVERYVQLLPEAELQTRSREILRDYQKWLKNQIGQMTRNDNCVLIDSPTAPKWGVSGARIIAGEYLFDISHKGGATICIRDERLVREQLKANVRGAFSQDGEGIVIYTKSGRFEHLGASKATQSDIDGLREVERKVREELDRR